MAVLGKLWDYWEARCAEIDMSWMILKDVVFFLWKVLIHLAFASDTERKGVLQWMCPIFTEMIQVVQLMCGFGRIPVTGKFALLYCMANTPGEVDGWGLSLPAWLESSISSWSRWIPSLLLDHQGGRFDGWWCGCPSKSLIFGSAGKSHFEGMNIFGVPWFG